VAILLNLVKSVKYLSICYNGQMEIFYEMSKQQRVLCRREPKDSVGVAYVQLYVIDL